MIFRGAAGDRASPRVALITTLVVLAAAGCSSGRIDLPIGAVAVDQDRIGVQSRCHDGARVDAIERTDRVIVSLSVKVESGGDCDSCSFVTLETPIGDRTIIDAFTGDPVSLTGSCQ